MIHVTVHHTILKMKYRVKFYARVKLEKSLFTGAQHDVVKCIRRLNEHISLFCDLAESQKQKLKWIVFHFFHNLLL